MRRDPRKRRDRARRPSRFPGQPPRQWRDRERRPSPAESATADIGPGAPRTRARRPDVARRPAIPPRSWMVLSWVAFHGHQQDLCLTVHGAASTCVTTTRSGGRNAAPVGGPRKPRTYPEGSRLPGAGIHHRVLGLIWSSQRQTGPSSASMSSAVLEKPQRSSTLVDAFCSASVWAQTVRMCAR